MRSHEDHQSVSFATSETLLNFVMKPAGETINASHSSAAKKLPHPSIITFGIIIMTKATQNQLRHQILPQDSRISSSLVHAAPRCLGSPGPGGVNPPSTSLW